MTNKELSKTYSPTEFEDEIYEMWETNRYFKPEKQDELGITNPNRPAFNNTHPPPNVYSYLDQFY